MEVDLFSITNKTLSLEPRIYNRVAKTRDADL